MIALAAMSRNRIIGKDGKLPWKSNKDDFAWFKNMTLHQDILMGRKTYESLPVPLRDRRIWILNSTRNGGIMSDGIFAVYVTDVKDFTEDLIVCGGASIYEQFLPKCKALYLTEFDFEVEGDVYFPDFEHLFNQKKLIKEITNGKIFKYYNE